MLCLSSVVGLFPDISVSPRKCWHQPLYRSTKQEPRARGQWLTLTVHRLYSLFRRLCNCCTNSNESILVTSRCTGGECHYPFLPRAGGTRGPCLESGQAGNSNSEMSSAPAPEGTASCHGGTAQHTLPPPCSPLAEKGARHLREPCNFSPSF